MLGWVTFLSIFIPILVVAAVGGLIFFAYYKYRYRTAKSNEALIITGPNLIKKSGKAGKAGAEGTEGTDKEKNIFTDEEGRSMKIIRGGGHFLRMNQTATPIPLRSFQLDIKTPKMYARGGVPIIAEAVGMVTVSGTLKGIAVYAEQFLGKKQVDIENEISAVLGSNLRAILSKMTVEEINEDREKFNADVTDVAQKQLDNMGFQITSMGLTDLQDADPENGYLSNLGRPIIANAKRTAETAEANHDKETRIFRANADKEAKEEEIKRQIETEESQKELDLKASAIKEETERARAKTEQSYKLENTKLEKVVQDETLKLHAQKVEEGLRIQQMERERQVKIEIEQSKIRKEKADADYYDTIKVAEADAQKAEIDGLMEVKVSREKGLAEAEVIAKKGAAEAESERLLAAARAENGDIVILEKLIAMLPELADRIAQPLANIESVKIIDMGGNGSGEGGGGGLAAYSQNVTKTMLGLHEPIKELIGLDIKELITNATTRGNTHTTVVMPKEETKVVGDVTGKEDVTGVDGVEVTDVNTTGETDRTKED